MSTLSTLSRLTQNQILHGKLKWFVLYFILLAFTVYLVVYAILPAYTSPYSRLYSSSTGYPAMLRKLGKRIPVETVTARYGNITLLISAPGVVKYLHEVPISIEVPGLITDIKVSLGEKVKAGAVLVEMSKAGYGPRMAALDVALSKSRKIQAKLDYEREEIAFEQGLIALSELEQYKNAYEESIIVFAKSKEAYESATLSRSTNIELSHADSINGQTDNTEKTSHVVDSEVIDVITPIDGTILEKNIQVGQKLIRPQDHALTVGKGLIFSAQFSQRYLNEVQVGQSSELFLRALPGKSYQTKIISIDRMVKSLPPGRASLNFQPYVFEVRLAFAEQNIAENSIVSGMNGYTLIKKNNKQLLIPESAMLRYSGQQGIVLVVDAADMSVHARKVSFSAAASGVIGIESGLNEGDLVVKNGQIALQENDLVVLKNPAVTDDVPL
ncbi:MAG: HlyD family secretion protein [Lentisphaeria bacterium]|jgi:HlyD family secretion protein